MSSRTQSQMTRRFMVCRIAIAVFFLAIAVAAQVQDYSKSVPQFPNVLAPYTPRHVPPPTMSNSSRTDQLVHDGKLMLSLSDAIVLALENNLDVGIARYNLSIADTDLLRTKAGAEARGVATGLASGTSLSVGFNNDRITTNSIFTTLVPQLDSQFRATVRQHLLSGFGFGPNMRFIRIARNNREISDISFRNQIVATVSQIQNIYW